jgi:beta-N-acetylhexosaminidase
MAHRRSRVLVAVVACIALMPASASSAPPRRPAIRWDPIQFGPARKAQMVAYARRHYGSFMRPTWRLINPHVIVIHYTDASYSSTWNTFANDVPDSELHELPATCAHFVIDTDGTIHQLVSLGTMCRHTVGLNWTAIGIEHVGFSDAQVLGDRAQIGASLRLVRWLRCRFHILVKNVIGHNESLSSPYHREDVVALRTQTHSDFNHADMQVYRARLRRVGGCGTQARPALRERAKHRLGLDQPLVARRLARKHQGDLSLAPLAMGVGGLGVAVTLAGLAWGKGLRTRRRDLMQDRRGDRDG